MVFHFDKDHPVKSPWPRLTSYVSYSRPKEYVPSKNDPQNIIEELCLVSLAVQGVCNVHAGNVHSSITWSIAPQAL